MIKTVTRIGNSQGIIFDVALMDLAHLQVGDQLNVTIHESGTIMLTPTSPQITAEQAARTARRLVRENAELFRRLA